MAQITHCVLEVRQSVRNILERVFEPSVASTGIASAIKDDFVPLDLKSFWSHPQDATGAADEIEKPSTLLTEEEMMMWAL
jgi:hypothetical protein